MRGGPGTSSRPLGDLRAPPSSRRLPSGGMFAPPLWREAEPEPIPQNVRDAEGNAERGCPERGESAPHISDSNSADQSQPRQRRFED